MSDSKDRKSLLKTQERLLKAEGEIEELKAKHEQLLTLIAAKNDIHGSLN